MEYNRPFIKHRADPYIMRADDGKYYFTASVPDYDGIILREADTIENLKDSPEKYLWRKHDEGPQSIHIWAPEIHHIFGGWYIYYAAGDKDDIWDIHPYVLRCTGDNPMTDSWEEMGRMLPADGDEFSFTQFSLDATVFTHRDKTYMVWAEKVGSGKQISNLYIAEMAEPNRLKTIQILLSSPDYSWERHGFWVNEGPFMLRHRGKIFITYSASDTSAAYCVGMLEADEGSDILDPESWSKSRKPVLVSDPEADIYGPGHNCFVEDGKGNTIMVYHARTERETVGNPLYVPNRHTMLMKVKWSENGEPVFGY